MTWLIMKKQPGKTINQVIAVDSVAMFGRWRKTENFVVCEVFKSEFKDLAAIEDTFGTWYNCLDSKGKRVVIFDLYNDGNYIVHSRGKWLGGDNT